MFWIHLMWGNFNFFFVSTLATNCGVIDKQSFFNLEILKPAYPTATWGMSSLITNLLPSTSFQKFASINKKKIIDIRTFGVSVSGSDRELTADWKSNVFGEWHCIFYLPFSLFLAFPVLLSRFFVTSFVRVFARSKHFQYSAI